MAYSELISEFNKVRDYMREFYVFGFKYRGKLGTKVLEPMMMYAGGLKASLREYVSFVQSVSGRV